MAGSGRFLQPGAPQQQGPVGFGSGRFLARGEGAGEQPNKAERAIAEFLEDKPTLQGVLQTLGRPVSAVANLLESGINLVKGDTDLALRRLKGAGGQVVDFAGDIIGAVPQIADIVLPGDVFPANLIPDITTPEDFRFGTDVLKTAGVGRGPVFDVPLIGKVSARGLGGFGLDVLVDPMRIGASQISRAVTPAVQAAKRLAVTKTPLKHLSTGAFFTEEAAIKGLVAGGRARRTTQEALDKVWDAARKAADDAGLDPDIGTLRFLRAIERKGELPTDPLSRRNAILQIKRRVAEYKQQGLTPREAARAAFIATTTPGGETLMAPFAGQAQTILRDILLTEQRAGVAISALRDPGINYLTRVLTPEAWEAMHAAGKFDDFSRHFQQWSAAHGSTKARKAVYSGQMIPDLNAAIEEMLGPDFAFKKFSEDPARIAAVRSKRLGQGIRASEFYQSIIRDFAEESTPALLKAGAQPIDNLLRAKKLRPNEGPFAGSTGKVLPREVAEAVIRTLDSWNDPATPKGILGHIVRATDHFKSWVTAPWPAFHFRNFVSDAWANYLSGLRNPRRYVDAIEVARDMARGGTKVWDQYGGFTSKQLVETMGDARALGFGSTSAAEFASLADAPAATIGKALGKGRLVKAGRIFGEMRENNGKIAHVLDRLAKGDSLDNAILSARKHLFDYGQLSPIEKRLFRRIVPFWTFTRKNLPLQLESLVTKPGKAANLEKFQRFLQARDSGDEGVDTTIIPRWVRRRIFSAERLKDGEMRVLSGLGIGFEELSLLDRPFEEFMSMLNPLIKGPIQGAANVDFFRGVPLARADVAPSYLRFMPGPLKEALSFRPVKDQDGETRFFRADPRWINFIHGIAVPGTSRAANFITQIDPALKTPEGRPEAGLRFVTGFRRSTMSPTRQMQENARRMLEMYVEHLKELQFRGVTFEIEDKFSIRRDIAPDDPRRAEAKEINRAIAKAQKALKQLSRTGQTTLLREGLRSMGQ